MAATLLSSVLRIGRRYVLLALLGVATTAGAAPLELASALDGTSTVSHMSVLEDPTHALTLVDLTTEPWRARFQPLPAGTTSRGLSASAWWVRLRVHNGGTEEVAWVADLLHSLTDYVDAYQVRGGQVVAHWALGDHRPFAERPIASQSIAVPFVTAPGADEEIYFRLAFDSEGAFDFYQQAWTAAEYDQYLHDQQALLGIVLGAALAMLTYNLVLMLSVRGSEYVWYSLYMAAVIVMYATFSGLGLRYVWTDVTVIADALPVLAPLAVFFCGIQFTRNFLSTAFWIPRADRMLKALLLLVPVAVLAFAFGHRSLAIKLIFVLGLSFSLFPVLGALLWARGHAFARGYTLAWSVLTAVTLMVILRYMGWLPTSPEVVWAGRLGFVAEAMLLALALADRINLLKFEKLAAEDARRVALERANEDLERKVEERTRELVEARYLAEELARTDQLTALPNRRAFFEYAEREFRRVVRYGGSLSLVMFDIDHFKSVNDGHGHAVGDDVLRHIARVVADRLRDTDIVSRIGGEEFALLLPQTRAADAALLADRLRDAIAAHPLEKGGAPLHITASFGVAERTEREISVDDLLARADAALYEAKHQGRNCVRASQS